MENIDINSDYFVKLVTASLVTRYKMKFTIEITSSLLYNNRYSVK